MKPGKNNSNKESTDIGCIERKLTGQNNITFHFLKNQKNRFRLFRLFGMRFSFFPLNRAFGAAASITLEAAIMLPIFMFLMFFCLFPLKIMESERSLLSYMEKIGEKMAVAEYVKRIPEDKTEESSAGEFASGLIDGAETGAVYALILSKASEQPVKNLYFDTESTVFSDENEKDPSILYIELKYEPDMPFSIFSIMPMKKSIVINKRAWIGSQGGRGRSKYDPESMEEDRIVYLSNNGSVYHEDPGCHYLSNVFLTAQAEQMPELRNESGGKYHACPSCRPGNTGRVYYFANGSAYHSSEGCSAVTSYARAVRLSEAEGLRACSYCGKSHSE